LGYSLIVIPSSYYYLATCVVPAGSPYKELEKDPGCCNCCCCAEDVPREEEVPVGKKKLESGSTLLDIISWDFSFPSSLPYTYSYWNNPT